MTDYSHQKQDRRHKHQQNKNIWETKKGSKTTLWIFQATNKRNLTQENLDMIKGNLKRETESLQISAQNNAIKNNYIKAKNRPDAAIEQM